MRVRARTIAKYFKTKAVSTNTAFLFCAILKLLIARPCWYPLANVAVFAMHIGKTMSNLYFCAKIVDTCVVFAIFLRQIGQVTQWTLASFGNLFGKSFTKDATKFYHWY